VTVETSSGRQRREAKTSGSHASAQDSRLHFGLGSDLLRAVEVRWPSGTKDRVETPEGTRAVVIKEGIGILTQGS
jgi:hypothetical protein